MNKNELVRHVAACSGLTLYDTERCINCYHEAVKTTLGGGNKVTLVGFGTFGVARRKEKVGVNPKTGVKITIKAKNVPIFKAGKALKELVK